MQLRRSILSFALSCAFISFSTPAAADVYVYTDQNGVLTFTNTPTHTGFRRVLREPGSSARGGGALSASYDGVIRMASGRYSIDADLIRAVIKTESDFNPSARSHKGAMGLMQLMPDTAKLHNVTDAYNPEENVDAGTRHLRLLLDRYQGDLELSLAAYNAGSRAVERHRGIPPYVETREYVRRVLQFYDRYRGQGLRLINSAHP